MNVEIKSFQLRDNEYTTCFCVTFEDGTEYDVGGHLPLADVGSKTANQIVRACWLNAKPLVEQFRNLSRANRPANVREFSSVSKTLTLDGETVAVKSEPENNA